MKTINDWIGLVIALLVLGFAITWLFAPEKKQAIQDWWYGMTVDCDQLHSEISRHQLCKTSDDCDLAPKESIRAQELADRYRRYCSAP